MGGGEARTAGGQWVVQYGRSCVHVFLGFFSYGFLVAGFISNCFFRILHDRSLSFNICMDIFGVFGKRSKRTIILSFVAVLVNLCYVFIG